jgi:protein ImuB
MALRIFRPRRAARVALASGQPNFVMADGVRGKVLDLAGPWRTSGDWWTLDPWQRDEWDIALSDGALYRIYCEPAGWFVEGSYD